MGYGPRRGERGCNSLLDDQLGEAKERHSLKLIKTKPLKSGKVSLIYSL